MSAPIIRPAEDRDRDAVWGIFRDIVLRGETYVYGPEMSREEALHLWMDAAQMCCVAESADRILGTYTLKTNQPGRGSHVCNAAFMVPEDARGHGIGKALCGHSLAVAQRLGYKAMQFNLVVSTNEPAIQLWQQMGFSIVGRLPKAFDHPERGLVDAYVMHRFL